MGRRWLHSVDLETDEAGRPLAEQALIRLDGVVTSTKRVQVGASKTLATLLGAALPDNLLGWFIAPQSGNAGTVRWNIGGAASASTPEIPAGVREIYMTKTVADTVQVYDATATDYVEIGLIRPRAGA